MIVGDHHLHTVGEKLRAMTDEELAETLGTWFDMEDPAMMFCDECGGCMSEEGVRDCTDECRNECIVRWLRSEKDI